MWNFPRIAADFFGDGAPPDNRFEQQYSCYPVSFAGREALEQGNKILLPQSALSSLARMNVTWPMLFEVSNPSLHRHSHSGVLEFSAEEGTCYMPYWMMKNLVLSEGELVKVVNTSLPKGTFVKLQPISVEFLEISDHKAVLEHCLRQFATLTVGDNIVIKHNNKSYEVEILECKPSNAVSIIETDVQVEFAAPKDYVQPERQQPQQQPTSSPQPAAPVPVTEDKFKLFGGSGVRLDGRPSQKSPSSPSPSTHSELPLPEFHCPKAEGEMFGNEEESTEPWKAKWVLPGGVRTSCAEFQALIDAGRLPGVVGKAEHRPENKPESSQPFVLFGGKGRACE